MYATREKKTKITRQEELVFDGARINDARTDQKQLDIVQKTKMVHTRGTYFMSIIIIHR